MPRHSVKKRNPFVKAIALGIGLIIALYLYYKVKTGDIIEVFLAMFEDTMTTPTTQSKLTDKERDSLMDLAAGFWVYQSDTNDIFTVDDRIEITENGYIWQVEQIRFTLPSGSKQRMVHVFHGFFYPSSKAVPDSTFINTVIRYLPQMWIHEGDTCVITKYFGESRQHKVEDNVLLDYGDFIVSDYMDDAIDVFLDGKSLSMNNRNYTPYGDSDIQKFFPEGLVDKVYNLSTVDDVKKDEMYAVKDKEVVLNKGIISKEAIEVPLLQECRDCFTLKDLLRKAIAGDLQKTTVGERNMDTIIDLMKKYYIPYCLKAKMSLALYNQAAESPRIVFSFDLAWQGKTENVAVEIQASALDKKLKEKEITAEIEKWRFPPLKKASPPVKVTFTEEL